MGDENQHVLQPLKPSTTTTTNAAATNIYSHSFAAVATSPLEPQDAKNINNIISKAQLSNSGIIFRLCLIISIGIISLWANHEASKGFSISIINDARETSPGKRFHLFYASNDEASRLILRTSKLVEHFLYPDGSYPKKQVNQVILRLSSRNLTTPVIVIPGEDPDQFVLHISPSVMEENNFRYATLLAIQAGIARMWIWDGSGNAPLTLVNGIVDFITTKLAISSGLSTFEKSDYESPEFDRDCWKSKNPKAVANFLNFCELEKPGFIRRLNQALKSEWHDQLVDDALGIPLKHLCTAHNSSSSSFLSST